MAIYFPSFCWGRHTSTNKNNTVTLELGACSSEIYPLCKIWKTHQSIIFPGKSWAPHGFSIGFPIYVGKSSQVFSFSHGNLAISCHILKVRHIQATIGAFAAILKNGRVVTWGHPCCGGDISSFQDTLRNVQDMEPLGVQRLRVGREPLGATNATRFPST
jgi:hypothetical protein